MQKGANSIYKSLIWGEQVSLAVLDTTALVNEAIVRHGLSPVAAAALGRTLTATAYLCSWLKDEKSALSVTINGGGAGGKIFAVGDGALRMRGFVENPHADLPPRADGKLDVGGFVGRKGTLSVVRDDGDMPFAGTSELVSGEIAEDFSAYFLTSEQRPTAIALGVKIGTDSRCLGAGGVFLQPLPGAGEDILSRTEKTIAAFANISSQIEDMGAEKILLGIEKASYSVRHFGFVCHCSEARAAAAVISLGREDAMSLIAERGEISVHCDYCNTDYRFGAADVEKLFSEKA